MQKQMSHVEIDYRYIPEDVKFVASKFLQRVHVRVYVDVKEINII